MRSRLFQPINSIWSRRDVNHSNNSLSLKYQINFDAKYHSSYNGISIDFFSHPSVGLCIYLNNLEAYDKLVNLVKKNYSLSLSKGKPHSWIFFYLNSLYKSEAESVFKIIDETVPTQLHQATFNAALAERAIWEQELTRVSLSAQ